MYHIYIYSWSCVVSVTVNTHSTLLASKQSRALAKLTSEMRGRIKSDFLGGDNFAERSRQVELTRRLEQLSVKNPPKQDKDSPMGYFTGL